MISRIKQNKNYYFLSFIFGIAMVSYFDFDLILFFIFLFTLFALLFLRQMGIKFLLINFLIIIFGIFCYINSLPKLEASKIWFYNDQKVEFIGVISAETDKRIDHQKITIQTEEIILNNKSEKISGKVLVKTGLYPLYDYGDKLKIICKIQAPEPIEDFLYDRYLGKENIYSVCYRPQITLLEKNQANFFVSKIYEQKNYWQKIIDRNLPEPQAALFSAITLGARKGILPALNDDFNATGTTHLIAISGFNITIIVTILMEAALLFSIPRKKAFYLVSLVLVCYIILIGFPASAVRAALMGWLVIFSRHVGRQLKLERAILLAACVMLFLNPKLLRDDAGFQLSFLAILGLVYLTPFFKSILKFLPEKFGFRESLETTLAAQTSTMPLIAYSFARVSLVAPVVNLLVIPAAVWLTIGGSAAIILTGVFPFLEKFLFWPNYLILTYLIKVIQFFAKVPFAGINL